MTVSELKAAVIDLDPASQQEFILALLPELGPTLVKNPGFLPKLLPVLLTLVRQSGVDLAQLLQLANLYAAPPVPPRD